MPGLAGAPHAPPPASDLAPPVTALLPAADVTCLLAPVLLLIHLRCYSHGAADVTCLLAPVLLLLYLRCYSHGAAAPGRYWRYSHGATAFGRYCRYSHAGGAVAAPWRYCQGPCRGPLCAPPRGRYSRLVAASPPLWPASAPVAVKGAWPAKLVRAHTCYSHDSQACCYIHNGLACYYIHDGVACCYGHDSRACGYSHDGLACCYSHDSRACCCSLNIQACCYCQPCRYAGSRSTHV